MRKWKGRGERGLKRDLGLTITKFEREREREREGGRKEEGIEGAEKEKQKKGVFSGRRGRGTRAFLG